MELTILRFWSFLCHITELVRRETELKLHFAVLPPPSRFWGVRLRRNCCAFSIRRNYGCVRGAGLGRRSLRGLFDVTSLPVGVRSAGLLCREVLGVVWQCQPENKQGRVWALFSFSPLCSLHQTPSASQPAQIWYGAVVGNGLSGARYVFVALFFECKKCMVLQTETEIEAANCVTCTETPVSEPGSLSRFFHHCLCASLLQ